MKTTITLLTLFISFSILAQEAKLDSSRLIYTPSGSEEFKQYYEYDALGRLMGVNYIVFDDDISQASEYYSYNEQGKIDTIRYTEENIFFSLTSEQHIEYINSDSIAIHDFYQNDDGSLEFSGTSSQKYDSEGKILAHYTDFEDEDGFAPFSTTMFYYNDAGKIDSILSYQIDFDDFEFKLETKWTFLHEGENLAQLNTYVRDFDGTDLYLAASVSYSEYQGSYYGKKVLKEFYSFDSIAFLVEIDSVVFNEEQLPEEIHNTIGDEEGGIAQGNLNIIEYYEDNMGLNGSPEILMLIMLAVPEFVFIDPISPMDPMTNKIKSVESFELDFYSDEYECHSLEEYFYDDLSSSTYSSKVPPSISVNPNPAFDEISINLGIIAGINNVVIYDIAGRKVKEGKFQNGTTINISDLKQGTYILDFFQDGNKIGQSEKLVKW